MNMFYRLNDTTDAWTGADKWAHLFGGAFAWMLGGWVLLALTAIAVEVIEVIRWRAWVAKGKPAPRPWFLCDLASLKDLAVDAAGGVLALFLTSLFRAVALIG